MTKLPYIQFYQGDWKKDLAVQRVSFAARGLWIELLFMMQESTTRGVLVDSDDQPIPEAQLCRMCGATREEFLPLIEELEKFKVFSRREDGAIFCRRMVRDEAARSRNVDNGKKGGRPPKASAKKAPPLFLQGDKKSPIGNESDSGVSSVVQEGSAEGSQVSEQAATAPVKEARLPEGWAEVCHEATNARMSFDPAPDGYLAVEVWEPLPLGVKREVVIGIRERVACGQYGPDVELQFIPTLENFILKKKHRDTLRPRGKQVAGGAKNAGLGLLERMSVGEAEEAA